MRHWILMALLVGSCAARAESGPYLEDRVKALEGEVRDLRERLSQIEQRPAAAPKAPAYATPLEDSRAPAAPTAPGWQTAAGWKKLRRGMSQIQVTQLLGEPVKRSGDRYAERWHYPDEKAWVEFDQVGELGAWQAPQ